MWWWRLKSDNLTELLRSLIGTDDGQAYLLVTDDEPPPWPIYQGPWSALIGVVLEQHFFEYALVASDLSWIVFDTHHDELIVAGRARPSLRPP